MKEISIEILKMKQLDKSIKTLKKRNTKIYKLLKLAKSGIINNA